MKRYGPLSMSLLLAAAAGELTGCGANFEEELLITGTAGVRSVFDVFITEIVNSLLDSFEEGETGAPDDAVNDDDEDGDSIDDGSDDGSDDGGSADDAAASIQRGQTLFTENACFGCHCADASGGCAADAPPNAGADVETVDDITRGERDHPGGKFDFSDQDIDDLVAFLATQVQDDDGGDGIEGDPDAGLVFFEANNCGACHGADGRSGFASSLQGIAAEDIFSRLNGTASHTGGTVEDAGEEDAADVAAWQASL